MRHFTATILALLMSFTASAATITANWQQEYKSVNEEDVTVDGFRLFYKNTASGEEKVIELGAVEPSSVSEGVGTYSLKITNAELLEGVNYDFTLTSYRVVNGTEAMSDRSILFNATIVVQVPKAPQGLTIVQ